MPTTRQLELFITVADAGSMRRAADKLGISQPSISKQIKALERDVGAELIVRTRGGRAVLSRFGEELLEDARKSVDMNRRIRNRSRNSQVDKPRIFLRDYLLSVIKARFAEFVAAGLARDTQFIVSEDPAQSMARDGSGGDAFAIFGSLHLPAERNQVSHVVLEQSCSIYAAPHVARDLASGRLAITELKTLFPAEEFKLTPWLERMFERAGAKQDNYEYGSHFIDLVMDRVAAGEGISIFMDMHAHHMVEAGKLVAVQPCQESLLLVILADQAVQAATFAQVCRAMQPLRTTRFDPWSKP